MTEVSIRPGIIYLSSGMTKQLIPADIAIDKDLLENPFSREAFDKVVIYHPSAVPGEVLNMQEKTN